MSNKKDLRLKLKTSLSSVSDTDLYQLSKLVSLNLKKFLSDQNVIQKNLVIGVFAPIQKEPNWLLELDETKIRTAYPVYANDKMVFKLARMSELLTNQDFGVAIKGPRQEAQIVNSFMPPT